MPLATTAPRLSSAFLSSGNKRKRSLRVHFCVEQPRVAYTYSQSDYDRSGLFCDVTPISPIVPQQTQQHDASIIPVHATITVVSLSVTTHPAGSPTSKKQKNKPRLSIDTSSIHGPLYLTNLTTNHQKRSLNQDTTKDHEDDESDDQTRENTKRNRAL
ncbi:hypothetical protein BCR43DRAFT_429739 [Syncephalastrum racemosum]|uniref:Uncharacterized protein n=1 Tax=Syncephalastrum racemosum TaxID=13706 RepID=A0A1X2HTC8_SYNRA|nr:hypothetical protein BCR43DRAFT_429739 [Syncephalastrum racemosum]